MLLICSEILGDWNMALRACWNLLAAASVPHPQGRMSSSRSLLFLFVFSSLFPFLLMPNLCDRRDPSFRTHLEWSGHAATDRDPEVRFPGQLGCGGASPRGGRRDEEESFPSSPLLPGAFLTPAVPPRARCTRWGGIQNIGGDGNESILVSLPPVPSRLPSCIPSWTQQIFFLLASSRLRKSESLQFPPRWQLLRLDAGITIHSPRPLPPKPRSARMASSSSPPTTITSAREGDSGRLLLTLESNLPFPVHLAGIRICFGNLRPPNRSPPSQHKQQPRQPATPPKETSSSPATESTPPLHHESSATTAKNHPSMVRRAKVRSVSLNQEDDLSQLRSQSSSRITPAQSDDSRPEADGSDGHDDGRGDDEIGTLEEDSSALVMDGGTQSISNNTPGPSRGRGLCPETSPTFRHPSDLLLLQGDCDTFEEDQTELFLTQDMLQGSNVSGSETFVMSSCVVVCFCFLLWEFILRTLSGGSVRGTSAASCPAAASSLQSPASGITEDRRGREEQSVCCLQKGWRYPRSRGCCRGGGILSAHRHRGGNLLL